MRWAVVGLVLSVAVVGVVVSGPSADRQVSVSIASGDSMGNEYPEVIVIENKQISRGDEIVFQNSAGGWVHHRVVGTLEGRWQTKGDANDYLDQRRDARGNVVGIGFPSDETTAGVVVASATVGVLGQLVASLVAAIAFMNVLEAVGGRRATAA